MMGVDTTEADTLVACGACCFVGFVGEDTVVAVIVLDPDVEGLGELFKTGFGLDNSFGVVVLVQVDVVNAAEVVNKDGGVVVSC